jgi:hypothetical protein
MIAMDQLVTAAKIKLVIIALTFLWIWWRGGLP